MAGLAFYGKISGESVVYPLVVARFEHCGRALDMAEIIRSPVFMEQDVASAGMERSAGFPNDGLPDSTVAMAYYSMRRSDHFTAAGLYIPTGTMKGDTYLCAVSLDAGLSRMMFDLLAREAEHGGWMMEPQIDYFDNGFLPGAIKYHSVCENKRMFPGLFSGIEIAIDF